MPPPAWLIRSTRTRTFLSVQSRCRRTAKSWRAAISTERTASADRRATVSPGSIPRPAWRIRSTRTQTILSVQSRCRRTAKSWWADFSAERSIGGQTRNFIARLDPTTGLADSFNPNPNSTVFAIAVQADGKILAGGDFTTLAPNGGAAVTRNRIARLETDGTARPDAQSRHRRQLCSRHRRSAGRQDSHRRHLYQRFGRGAQQHCPLELGRHARHRLQPERER